MAFSSPNPVKHLHFLIDLYKENLYKKVKKKIKKTKKNREILGDLFIVIGATVFLYSSDVVDIHVL